MIIINKKTVTRTLLIILVICTVAFIWSNSLESADVSSDKSSIVVEKVKPIIDPHDKIDDDVFVKIVRKVAHFSEFALLGGEFYLLMLTFESIRHKKILSLILPIGISFTVAVIDECLQLTSVGRSCQFSDMMIDLAGIISGVFFILIAIAIIKEIHSRAE